MDKLAISVDLGGTKILIGAVDTKGKIITHLKLPTNQEKGKEFVIQQIIKGIKKIIRTVKSQRKGEGIDFLGVGVGSPGPLNQEKGIIYFAPNLKGWRNVRIRDIIQNEIKMPVYLDNDANMAALGEFWLGAGKSKKNIICVTLGTGVGSGIIINGQLVFGAHGSAGEFGHMVVELNGRECGCGKRGCVETYSSAKGIVASFKEALKSGKKTILSSEITSENIYKNACKGDKLSKEVLASAGRYLGIALSNVANLLDLELAVIGGNVAEAGDFILKPARQAFLKHALYPAKKMKIIKAKLGTYAGLIGAAKTVFLNTTEAKS